MQTAQEIVPAGHWLFGDAAGHIELAFDDRFRRRFRLRVREIGDVLLDLPQARVLRDGEALRLEDGRLIAIHAAKEPLIEVRAASPGLLMRLAWHIGNRHLPARLTADRILLRRDHVMAAMLTGLGAHVRDIDAPFDPEGGAYAEASTGHQDHDHHHGTDHHHHHD
jgi:urease accessory protein